jgi:hypothetical protein
VEGVREVQATMAATTILWVQETFDPGSETFREVVEIAGKWNAAVELVRYVAGEEDEVEAASEAYSTPPPSRVVAPAGIEDDVEGDPVDDGGLKATLDELARLGRAGGGRYVCGVRGSLVATCCGTVGRSLVVVGNLFIGKDPAAKVRLTREMSETLGDRMRVPVVTVDELRTHYLFGSRDVLPMVGYLAFIVLLYLLVFTHQTEVLDFLLGTWAPGRASTKYVVAVAVFGFVPLVAYAYGQVARSLMKLIKME